MLLQPHGQRSPYSLIPIMLKQQSLSSRLSPTRVIRRLCRSAEATVLQEAGRRNSSDGGQPVISHQASWSIFVLAFATTLVVIVAWRLRWLDGQAVFGRHRADQLERLLGEVCIDFAVGGALQQQFGQFVQVLTGRFLVAACQGALGLVQALEQGGAVFASLAGVDAALEQEAQPVECGGALRWHRGRRGWWRERGLRLGRCRGCGSRCGGSGGRAGRYGARVCRIAAACAARG